MKPKLISSLPILAALAISGVANAQALNGGNLVVTRVGDGSAVPTNAANPVFIDQYTTSGTLVSSISIPTTPSGANLPCTNSGTATSELSLNLSADHRFLTFGGYDATVGTTSVASSTVPRVVARVGMDGSVDTTTQLGTLYSGNNIRSVWTTDGTQFWVAGANGGIVYSPLGGAGALIISNTSVNNRVINSDGADLYFMTGAGATRGFFKIAGLPTTSGNTALNQIATGQTSSPYDFIVKDANDIYIADDTLGLQKWVNNGGTWSVAYTVTAGAAFVRSLATDGTNIFAVTTDDRIVETQDTGSGFAPFTTVATAATNTHLRGIKYLPATQQTVHASSVAVTSGTLVSGGLAEVQEADAQYLVATPSVLNHGFIVSGPVQVIVTGTAPTGGASVLKFKGISHASRAGVGQTIELFDYVAGAYVAVDTRALSPSDQTVEINASNPSRFVDPSSHEVRARLTYKPMATVNSLNWSISIDQTAWTITP